MLLKGQNKNISVTSNLYDELSCSNAFNKKDYTRRNTYLFGKHTTFPFSVCLSCMEESSTSIGFSMFFVSKNFIWLTSIM